MRIQMASKVAPSRKLARQGIAGRKEWPLKDLATKSVKETEDWSKEKAFAFVDAQYLLGNIE